MNGMSAGEAVQTYSILTIGNGLVSQIPALLISISAGMVVTRVASDSKDSNLGRDVAGQILAQPKAIAVASSLLCIMGIIPGLPKIPFFFLAATTGSLAYGLFRARKIQQAESEKPGQQAAAKTEGPQLAMTIPLILQTSEALTPFVDVNTPEGKKFCDSLVAVRNGLYYDTGVMFPAIQITGNSPTDPGTYVIWANEVPVVNGQIRMDAVLVNDSAAKVAVYGLQGEDTKNPTTGKPAAWIPRDQKDRAREAGLQVWDTQDILILHVTHFLKKHAREFVGLQEVQIMISAFKTYYPALVEETVPKPVAIQQFTEILQRLVEEDVSVRDLKTILQTLCEWGRVERDVPALTERVRAALKRKICYQISEGRPLLFVYQLDPAIEDLFRDSIRPGAAGPSLAMEPAMVRQVLDAARAQIGALPPGSQRPAILTDAEIRRFVKKVLEFMFPDVAVLSYDQLTPQINLQPLGVISPVGTAQIAAGN
jgi:type III secretion protein V